ncbi:DgyrCDS52 [Dimorphilus gyrociliatus]|nr:DgyrCDS52 [Dimorphilus gyrociliatus]
MYDRLVCSRFELIVVLVITGVLLESVDKVDDSWTTKEFKSTPTNKSGFFSSPNYPNKYPGGQRIFLRFKAQENERVKIKFVDFDVHGLWPECQRDYMEIYIRVENISDYNKWDLHNKYCGNSVKEVPKVLVSYYRIIIIGLFTVKRSPQDAPYDRRTGYKGFAGTYEFISDSIYNIGKIGNRKSDCRYLLTKPNGTVVSPTYPGQYSDNMNCEWKIEGPKRTRIYWRFEDLDVFDGGKHCPYDSVVIYDGNSINSPTIGTFCGKDSGLEIWSTTNSLIISFTTKSGRQSDTNIQFTKNNDITMAGFRAIYRISNKIVSLDSNTLTHVRGTECDERIKSEKESAGVIKSPHWPGPVPTNITCVYTIDGLQDLHNLEKVKLNITNMTIPKYGEKCTSGFVKVYLSVPEKVEDSLSKPPDSTLCGQGVKAFTSAGPRMVLVFHAHNDKEYTNRRYGFEASYRFVTDYAIPGKPLSKSVCHFRYSSRSARVGRFNSPRFPSRYPPNTKCTYELLGRSDEWIRLSFKKFDLDTKPDCTGDVLYAKEYDNGKEALIGRYCGKLPPGPLQSDTSKVKFVFQSGSESAGSGFKIKYEFFRRVRPTSDSEICGANNLGREYRGGVIISSNFGHKYKTNRTCDWIISVKAWARVLIHFSEFNLEGHLEKQGCANAVLKIYTRRTALPTYEFCGPQLPNRTFLSDEGYMKIRFVTVDKAIGGKGFKLSWAAVRKQGRCEQFICRKSGYCIDNSLRCDKIPHCGLDDDSDETSECPKYGQDSLLTMILGIIIALVVFVILIVCIVHRKRRNGNHRSGKNRCKQLEVKYVTRTTNNDRLRDGRRELLEHTEKVSNV